MIAILIMDVEGMGTKKLFRLDPPLEGHELVVVSGVSNAFATETYIFPADKSGKITDYGELEGSFQGGVNIEEALRNAGYEVKEENDD